MYILSSIGSVRALNVSKPLIWSVYDLLVTPSSSIAGSLIEEYTTLEDKRDDVIDAYKRTHQQQQIQASTGTDENSAAASHINTNQPTEDVANNNTEDENSTPDPPAATNSQKATSQLTRQCRDTLNWSHKL